MIARLSSSLPLVIRMLLVSALGLAARPMAAAPAPSALPDDLTPIYLIQGDGPSTPLSRQRVSTFGLVSGVQSNGFYLQDPTGDDNPQTSDGIFVYTSSAPKVHEGECILVRAAEVSEYYEKTELTTPRTLETLPIDLCGSGALPAPLAPLPAPNVEPESLLEPFEGMLVAFEELQGVVQGPTKRFSSGSVEIALIADHALPFVQGGRVFQSNPADAAGLIFLGNGLGADLPQVGWGDRVRVRAAEPGTPVRAVIDYSFGKYLLLPLPGHEIQVLSRHESNRADGPNRTPAPSESAPSTCWGWAGATISCPTRPTTRPRCASARQPSPAACKTVKSSACKKPASPKTPKIWRVF